MRRLPLFVLLAATLSLFTISTAQTAAQSASLAYAARGPYAVGTRDFVLPDPDPVGTERPLTVTLWYPAQAAADAAERMVYTVGTALFVPVTVPGQARLDAPPDASAAPYPLVIFSHGSGSSRVLSLFLTEQLASYGFVVLAAEHTPNAVLDSLNQDYFMAQIPPAYLFRPRDVLRLLTFADTLNTEGDFAGLLDTRRAAVVGHSFGGYTALAAAGAGLDFAALAAWCADNAGSPLDAQPELPYFIAPERPEWQYGACFLLNHAATLAALHGGATPPDAPWQSISDPRVAAVLVFAPWNAPALGQRSLAAVTVPAMMMVGSGDVVTPPERDTYNAFAWLGSTDKRLAVFEGANHFIFMDECPPFMTQYGFGWACSDAVWALPDAHAIINHLSVAFLRAVLLEDAAAAAALGPDAVQIDGVRYEVGE